MCPSLLRGNQSQQSHAMACLLSKLTLSSSWVCISTGLHLIEPIEHKAAGSWATVQRHRSLMQCGSTVNIHLQLLQSILVPALHCNCKVWGMHSPDAGSAKRACLALQKVYDLACLPLDRAVCHSQR